MSKKCDDCKRCAINDDMTTVVMSSADWQRNEQRHLRREKRLIAIIILVIVLFVGSNMAWIVYENQHEDVVETEEIIVDAEDSGTASYIGNDGDIYNGKNNSKEN